MTTNITANFRETLVQRYGINPGESESEEGEANACPLEAQEGVETLDSAAEGPKADEPTDVASENAPANLAEGVLVAGTAVGDQAAPPQPADEKAEGHPTEPPKDAPTPVEASEAERPSAATGSTSSCLLF